MAAGESGRSGSRSVGWVTSGVRRRLSIVPAGWREAALAVGGELCAGCIEVVPVPELAGDLAVSLVQGLAVVGIEAQADLVAAAMRDLAEPIGVGEGLACEADDVGGAVG